MRVLLSAYACEPDHGSEPGAGYALVRAAAEKAECWVLTRGNNIPSLSAAFEQNPAAHPVHFIGVDASSAILRLKRRLGSVRLYYALWQRLAWRRALELDSEVDFDLVHHATWSAFWLPVGVMGVAKPLVVGPVSGGTVTPRSLLRYLGPKGLLYDGARWVASRSAGLLKGRFWREHVDVLIAQNEQTSRYATHHLVGDGVPVIVHPHASNPTTPGCSEADQRVPEVLFVGRLLRWKGVLLALEAFAQVNVPGARLVFIGEGEAEAVLDSRIRRLGLQDEVSLLGALPREEVLRRMCQASVLVFPSFHDSAGFVVSEALSMGVPVVCLNHGGPGALAALWPDVPHYAVEVGPAKRVVEQLGDALRTLLTDPAPVLQGPVGPATDLSGIVSEAYERALRNRQ